MVDDVTLTLGNRDNSYDPLYNLHWILPARLDSFRMGLLHARDATYDRPDFVPVDDMEYAFWDGV